MYECIYKYENFLNEYQFFEKKDDDIDVNNGSGLKIIY